MLSIIEIKVPDIGDFHDVDVIEVLVKVGETVLHDQSLITIETDKATMEIPCPKAGVVESLLVKTGDKVSEGSAILKLKIEGAESSSGIKSSEVAKPAQAQPSEVAPLSSEPSKVAAVAQVHPDLGRYLDEPESTDVEGIHAGPATRRLARELGVSLNAIKGSGRRGRVLTTDIHQHVKAALSKSSSGGGLSIAPAKAVDFSQFGPIEHQPLNRIKQLTAENLHRNWVTIPHVTQFDEADITELEAFRLENKKTAEQLGLRLTPLVFIMKAVVSALRAYPQFNSSLAPNGQQLILKKYFHIGVAVDTPNGLVVPVIQNVDAKSMYQLAQELQNISLKARDKGLSMQEMSGSCFTISSLGGIGGTAFTPIINAPDVAILGVSKAKMQPVYQEGAFVPRLMLPLSLSYDHRVIDGAEAARFSQHIVKQLSDIRQLLL